jgi:hypothetical protein
MSSESIPVDVQTTRKLLINSETLLKLLRTSGIEVPADATVLVVDDGESVEDVDMVDKHIEVSYIVNSSDSVDISPKRRASRAIQTEKT